MRDESEIAVGSHTGRNAGVERIPRSPRETLKSSRKRARPNQKLATSSRMCRAKGFLRSLGFPRVRVAHSVVSMHIGMPLLCPAIPDIFPHPGEEKKQTNK